MGFVSGKVTDADKGLGALLVKAAGMAKGATVTVGIHAAEGGASHEGSALTVAEIGTLHEFGSGRIPQRSFLRAWADANQAQNVAAVRAVAEQVVKGKYSAETGLDRLGLLFVGGVQAKISAGIPPPNAESTVEKKGSSTPLINTGQLRSSIRHKVVKGGGG